MKLDPTFWRAMAAVALAGLLTPIAHAQVNVPVGNLANDESVTITFEVTINTPLTVAVTQLSAQGTASGSNFGPVNTDDPETGTANDATITPLSQNFDFGDALDPTFPTLLANNGARHFIPGGGATLYLGTVAPDAETDGQPNGTATGDDTAATDDEDGVTLPASIVSGQSYTVTVVVTGTSGILNAWLDWNLDGDWDDAGEQIITDLAVAGTTPIIRTAPAFTLGGTPHSRFRLSTQSGLATTGLASDGEVEDYQGTLVANSAPVANTDSYTVAEGGTLNQTDGDGTATGTTADDGVLANDTDSDLDPLTAILVTPPANASSFTLTADGSFSYTHNGGETTSDSFTYKANDGAADSPVATVNITVTEINDPMVANDDTLTDVAEDSGLRVIPFADLLGNDSRGTGEGSQTLTVIAVGTPVGGTVQINGLTVEFTPTANYHGPASFEYTAQDNGTTAGSPAFSSDTAIASFNLTPVADTPSVTGATTQEGQQTTSGLVISRNAADGAEVTHFKITGIQNGTLFQNNGSTPINNNDFITFADGNAGLKFTPTAGLFSPGSTFSLDVQASTSAVNGGLGGGVVTASMIVNANLDFGDAPDPTYPTLAASDGARHVVPAGGATLYLGSVAPDIDPDGQPNATATGDDLAAAPDDEEGVTLPVSFVGGLASNVTVTASVSGGLLNAWIDWNDDGDWDDTDEQIATDLAVSAGANVISVLAPITISGGGSFARFRLSTDSGLATTGQASDGEVEDYEVTLIGNAVPVANTDSYTVTEGGTLNQTDGDGTATGTTADDGVLANDTDADLDLLTAILVTPPANASSFTLTADGSFSYTHNGGETTSDSFTYKANDGLVDSPVATVNITVTEVNDPVVANDDTLTDVAEDSGLRVIPFADLLGNDSRGTGEGSQTLTVIAVGTPVGGTVQINGLTVEFTPTPGYSGPASFEYTAQDNGTTGGSPAPSSDTAVASFSITPVADTPSVTGATTQEGQQTTSGLVLTGDPDVTHFKITGILNGALFQNNGSTPINTGDFITAAQGNAGLKFTPTAGLYSPGTTFAFDVQGSTSGVDGGLGGSVVTASITVNPNLDFGDAPDPTYPTLLASDGARHVVLSTGITLYLGAVTPDTEANGQPNATSTGDDTAATDDEEGVTLPAAFVGGFSSNVTVTASVSGGRLNAWIDWNRDGDWSDAGEQIATDLAVNAGANVLGVPAPGTAGNGPSFARFRLSSASGLAPTGQASDGEVEDYAVTLVGNTAPLAVDDTLGTKENTPVNASIAKLLANDSDPDGDPKSISAVSATSTNGGTLVLGLSIVTYTPVNGFVGEDRFTYTLSDGRGGTDLGTVVVTVTSSNAPSLNKVSITLTPGGRLLRFAGIPTQQYVIQSGPTANGPWTDLSPVLLAGPTGLIEYLDNEIPIPPVRLYRTRVGP